MAEFRRPKERGRSNYRITCPHCEYAAPEKSKSLSLSMVDRKTGKKFTKKPAKAEIKGTIRKAKKELISEIVLGEL
jgi:hypothetical protein